jgi:hypothetical protein
LPAVREERFGSWTRAEEKTVYYGHGQFHRRRRLMLGLFGVALILVSVGWTFAEVQVVGNDSFVAPKQETMKLTVPRMKRVNIRPRLHGHLQR